jgi:hypothetical protein
MPGTISKVMKKMKYCEYGPCSQSPDLFSGYELRRQNDRPDIPLPADEENFGNLGSLGLRQKDFLLLSKL